MTAAERIAAIHAAAVARPWSAPEMQSLLDDPHVFALEAEGAFLLARVVADEAEVLMIATHPGQRRKGRAAALVAQFHGEACERGAARAFLEVAEDNAAARALYAAAGYAQVGRRAGYYARPGAPPVAALVLSHSLP